MYHVTKTITEGDGTTRTLLDLDLSESEMRERHGSTLMDAIEAAVEADRSNVPWYAVTQTTTIGDISITVRIECKEG